MPRVDLQKYNKKVENPFAILWRLVCYFKPVSYTHLLGRYKGWTAAALIFGITEVVLELLIPMLMSTIVDGGLYRESTFMLQGLFSPELIANRNRFVLTVGAIMAVSYTHLVLGTMLAPISALACVLKQIAEKDGAPAEEAAAE